MAKFKKGDEVILTSGRDKGQRGKIEKVLSSGQEFLIEGVNLYKKHVRARGANRPGGVIQIAKPVAVGSIALICSKCQKPTRAGFRFVSGQKERFCKQCQQAF